MFVFSLKMRICNLQIHICNLKMNYNPNIVRFSPAERKVFSCLWQVSGIKNLRVVINVLTNLKRFHRRVNSNPSI